MQLTSLIPDLLDGGTVRPGSPGVEGGGEVLRVSQGLQLGREVEVSLRVDPHQGTEVLVTGLWVETDNSQHYRNSNQDSLTFCQRSR